MNKYEEDLNYFLGEIEKRHIWFYFDKSKDDLNNFVKEYLSTHKLDSKYKLSYFIQCILKYMLSIYDSHTFCFYDKPNKLPIILKFIGEDLYIINSFDKNLKFSKVLKINDFTVEELIKKIKKSLPCSNEAWLKAKTEEFLSDLNIINELCLSYNDTSIFTIEIKGKQKDYVLSPNKEIKLEEDKNYEITLLDKVIKISYSKCVPPKTGSVIDFVNNVKQISKQNNITNFIIDIRGNTGGDNTIIYPLLDFLKGPNFNVITLTDKNVFSSGRFALIDLINIGIRTFGEEIGTSLNCFGNVKTFNLPNTNLIITYSTKYFDYNPFDKKLIQYTNKDDMREIKSFKPIFYKPDYYVWNSLKDYKNGNDKVVDKAIKLFKAYVKK